MRARSQIGSFVLFRLIACLPGLITPQAIAAVHSGPLRISFLTDEPVIKDTLAELRAAHCPPEGVAGFKRAIDLYNRSPFLLDTSRFPPKQNGFYQFDSAPGLIKALPHKLCETDHSYQLNCYDLVVLLGLGQLRTGLKADANFGPFMVRYSGTNGTSIGYAATPRDAFAGVYPKWYVEFTQNVFPQKIADERICLVASLFSFYPLPQSTSREHLKSAVHSALKWGWRRNSLTFPTQWELVLCHDVFLRDLMMGTSHAGLLFPIKKGFMYIEKAGGSGPFVRVDLQDKQDLLPLLADHLKGRAELGCTDHFVTFNSDQIELLPVNETTSNAESTH